MSSFSTMKVMTLVALFFAGVLTSPPSDKDSRLEGKRLIQFTEEGPAVWLTPLEVDVVSIQDINFMDVTDIQSFVGLSPPQLFAIPTQVRFQPLVEAAIEKLSVTRVEEFMVPFTNFNNRYYTATTGVDASHFIHAKLNEAISKSNYPAGQVVASLHSHGSSWAQPSIIARIQGESPAGPIVVLGAHMDSTSTGMPNARAPGADDNASGSATILEAFRGILESGFIPKYTIEFQWYAAEEVGLRGSAAIVDQYRTAGIEVIGMVNFDMSGYLTADDRIAVITDFVDPELSQFLRLLVDAYSNFDWVNRACGYACSDHASYHRGGYRASHAHEGRTSSPFLHTTSDTLSRLNYARVLEFSRLAAGFAIELAEPRV